MTLADGLRKIGFRKWYERELLKSHAHLAATFLCLVGVFAAFEGALRFRALGEQLGNIAAVVLLAGAGVWALRRYLYLLTHAEAVAHQADCPGCGVYGRLRLVDPEARGSVVQVRCIKCAHEWRIEG